MDNEFNYTPKFGGGSDIYLKLNDWTEKEQTVKVRLASATYTRIQFRHDDEAVDTKNWDISDYKEAIENSDYQKSQKFAWVVIVRGEGDNSDEVKVWEAGTGVFKKISAIANDADWAPINEVDLKIIRRGLKKDARYDVVPSPTNRGQISEEEFANTDPIDIEMGKYLPGAMKLLKFKEVFGE